jgi:BlaI family transcriptional regulator, penicillinase repressor
VGVRPPLEVSRRERELVETIYRLGAATVGEVRAALAEPPSYSAVRTMLTRLVAKGHLRVERDGTRYVYHPTVEREAVSTHALRRVLDTFFGGSLARAVSALIDDRGAGLSAEEARQIRRELERARREGR